MWVATLLASLMLLMSPTPFRSRIFTLERDYNGESIYSPPIASQSINAVWWIQLYWLSSGVKFFRTNPTTSFGNHFLRTSFPSCCQIGAPSLTRLKSNSGWTLCFKLELQKPHLFFFSLLELVLLLFFISIVVFLLYFHALTNLTILLWFYKYFNPQNKIIQNFLNPNGMLTRIKFSRKREKYRKWFVWDSYIFS